MTIWPCTWCKCSVKNKREVNDAIVVFAWRLSCLALGGIEFYVHDREGACARWILLLIVSLAALSVSHTIDDGGLFHCTL